MPRPSVFAASALAVATAFFPVPWPLVPLGVLPVAPRFLPVLFAAVLLAAVAAGRVVVATAPRVARRRRVVACVACLGAAVVVQAGSFAWGMLWHVH